MAGRFLLDTTIIVDLFAGDSGVEQGLKQAEAVFLPSIAVGELLYGARLSSRVEENRAKVQTFAAGNAVLNCDLQTGEWYAQIKAGLSPKALRDLVGQPAAEESTELEGLRLECLSYGIVYWAEQWVPSGLAALLFSLLTVNSRGVRPSLV
jgi:predicted nucleic acid-binding protein